MYLRENFEQVHLIVIIIDIITIDINYYYYFNFKQNFNFNFIFAWEYSIYYDCFNGIRAISTVIKFMVIILDFSTVIIAIKIRQNSDLVLNIN